MDERCRNGKKAAPCVKHAAAVILAATLLSALAAPGLAINAAPDISAQAAILVEADTGTVLLEQNADERRLIASTTKIMTALVVLEQWDDLDAVITVEPSWTAVEGSSMYLTAGQELTVRELLYGLLLASGNDAATALACVTAGSEAAFADLMNEKAAALGCENTHYTNPHGLDDEEHYSTARDLAAVMAAAIENETFCEITGTTSVTIGSNTITNHNRLLSSCEGVFGGKTGYTTAAGRTLVTCCERGNMTLICVTLTDPNDWADHTALYNWAYGAYTNSDVLSAAAWTVPVVGGEAEEVSVATAAPLHVLRTTEQEVTVQYTLPAFVYAAVEAGQNAGQAVAYVDGQKMGAVELIYTEDIARTEEQSLTLRDKIKSFFGWMEGNIYKLS
ncbi:MAG: D-alanyl-D-alanine carboxypeptidase [Oscillospiraceae bacterium]|nr:D-alanyl-D-alanine carboxypeptidase [Oscillospiraceae bacterium]